MDESSARGGGSGARGRGRGRGRGAKSVEKPTASTSDTSPSTAPVTPSKSDDPKSAEGKAAEGKATEGKAADGKAVAGKAKSAFASAAIAYRFGEQQSALSAQDWNVRFGPPGLRFAPRSAAPPKQLLTDAEVQHFIRFGYVVVRPSALPSEFHTKLFAHCEQFFAGAGAGAGAGGARGDEQNPGNNVLPVMPALNQVFDDPAVSGALESLLGDGYVMHAHRFAHPSFPGRKEQAWHKDSYFGFNETRGHRPAWLMAMYYPQNTTLAMGPTGILPASQYYASSGGDRNRHFAHPPADWAVTEWPAECPAGSVVLIAYDIWHKGMANNSALNRYMFKFQFIRTTQPTAPTWNCTATAWNPFAEPPRDHASSAAALARARSTANATAVSASAAATGEEKTKSGGEASAATASAGTATAAATSDGAAPSGLSAEATEALLKEHDSALGRDAVKAAARHAVAQLTLARVDQLRASRAADRAAKAAAKPTAATANGAATTGPTDADAAAHSKQAANGKEHDKGKSAAKKTAPTASITPPLFGDANELAFLSGRLTQQLLDEAKRAAGDAVFSDFTKDELKALKTVVAQSVQRLFQTVLIPALKREGLLHYCGDLWVDVWRWMCGQPPVGAAAAPSAALLASPAPLDALRTELESSRVYTAYRVAREYGPAAVTPLLAAVAAEGGEDAEGRNAMFALIAIGRGALPGLIALTASAPHAFIASRAAFAIGEIGGAAGGLWDDPALFTAAVSALSALLSDNKKLHNSAKREAAQALPRLFVRRTATTGAASAAAETKSSASSAGAGAAGHVCDAAVVTALTALRAGAADPMDEQVRYMSALGLGRVALALSPASPSLAGASAAVSSELPAFPAAQIAPTVAALATALNDGNRYVVANAIEALKLMRVLSPDDALELALRALTVMRWCPITTMQKAF